MERIIILFGIVIAGSGLVLTFRPSFVTGFIDKYLGNPWLYAFAIAVRLVVGLLLVQLAAQSRFPLVITILGWVMIAAAVFLAALGLKRFTRFIRWIIDKVKPWVRAGGLFALVFGAFLVYAFV